MSLLLLFASGGGADVTAPTLSSATINSAGTQITLALSETVTVNTSTGFTVSLSGGAATLTYVSGSGSSSLIYSISRTVYQGETGTITYVTVSNGIEDGAGNDLASFAGSAITNGSTQVLDTTAPTVTSAAINSAGTTLTLNASESVVFGAGGNGGITLSMSGGAVTATYSSGAGATALVYSLSRTIYQGETGTRSYVQPGNGIEDVAGNDMLSFTAQALTNNSTQVLDVTAPTRASTTINAAGTLITRVFSEAVEFGSDGSSGFVLTMSGGALTEVYAGGAGTNTLTFTPSRTIYQGETGTDAYTQPGDGVTDLAPTPNVLATYSGASITNSSTAQVGELDPGDIVFAVQARSSRNPGGYFAMQTTAGEINKVTVDWALLCAGEGADVVSVAWAVESGTMSINTPFTDDNKSIILLTTAVSERRGLIQAIATLTDGQHDVVNIKVRCREQRA